jgi:transposase-like protein
MVRKRRPIPRHRHSQIRSFFLCGRRYVSYKLSYRDLAEMMLERGIQVAPSTICRWVQRYIPEFEKRWNRFSCPVGTSWRVEETYVNIKGKWNYLYRAVYKQDRSADFHLSRNRSFAAAQAFFRKALGTHSGHGPSHAGRIQAKS